MKIAVRETIAFITGRFPKLSREEAYMIASIAVDYHVTQAAAPGRRRARPIFSIAGRLRSNRPLPRVPAPSGLPPNPQDKKGPHAIAVEIVKNSHYPRDEFAPLHRSFLRAAVRAVGYRGLGCMGTGCIWPGLSNESDEAAPEDRSASGFDIA
jgi:hypothetical protein